MKRGPEELDALIADALRRFGPITAYALASAMRERGHRMTEIQAYRVLKRLIARDEARQVWLGRRYAARTRGEPPSMALVCRTCDRVRFTPAVDAYAALRAHAAATGFTVGDVVLEASGLCGGCRNGADSDQERGDAG